MTDAKPEKKAIHIRVQSTGSKRDIERREDGQPISAQYEIHMSQLYKWRDQALIGLLTIFNEQAEKNLAEKEAEWQKEREALYVEIERLTTKKT